MSCRIAIRSLAAVLVVLATACGDAGPTAPNGPVPEIARVNPAEVVTGPGEQMLVVSGQGFAAGLVVLLTRPDGARTTIGGDAIQSVQSVSFQVSLPFDVAALWWQRRHGVSHVSYWETVFGGWIALGAVFTFLCLAVLIVMGFARLVGDRWWMAGAAVFIGLYALFTFISPYLVGSSHKLRDPRLQADYERLARKEGVPGIPVRVQDVHGDTSAANAFDSPW